MGAFVEATIGEVFTTGYYAATDGTVYSSSSYVEDVMKGIIHTEVLEKKFKPNLKLWSCSNAIMEALICRVVNNTYFIAPVGAIMNQCATIAIEEELHAEPKLTKEILLPPDRSPSAAVSTTSD